MKKDINKKAKAITASLAAAFADRNSSLINHASYRFLVCVFELPALQDLADFQDYWKNTQFLAEELLSGGPLKSPESRASEWRQRFGRTRVEADKVVSETIEEIARLCRTHIGLVEQLDENTLVTTLQGGVEIHLAGDNAYTLHRIGGGKTIVPLEISLLEGLLSQKPQNINIKAIEAEQTAEVKQPDKQPRTSPNPEPKLASFELQLPPLPNASVGQQLDFELA
jgi:hypothetical protein